MLKVHYLTFIEQHILEHAVNDGSSASLHSGYVVGDFGDDDLESLAGELDLIQQLMQPDHGFLVLINFNLNKQKKMAAVLVIV